MRALLSILFLSAGFLGKPVLATTLIPWQDVLIDWRDVGDTKGDLGEDLNERVREIIESAG